MIMSLQRIPLHAGNFPADAVTIPSSPVALGIDSFVGWSAMKNPTNPVLCFDFPGLSRLFPGPLSRIADRANQSHLISLFHVRPLRVKLGCRNANLSHGAGWAP